MSYYLWVAAGGAVGAVSRVFLQNLLNPHLAYFPIGTFVANVVGSFIMGLMAVGVSLGPVYLQPFLLGGFLGALTTMSSFAYEVIKIGDVGESSFAAIYLGATLLACLGACYVGTLVARMFTT